MTFLRSFQQTVQGRVADRQRPGADAEMLGVTVTSIVAGR